MQNIPYLHQLHDWIDQFPWLEMLISIIFLICVALIASFLAKHVIVRGIRSGLRKLSFFHDQSFFNQHSVIRHIAHIVPALIIMKGITSVPHLSASIQILIQMAAQAFIFITIAWAISDFLNIFNLIYQRNPNSRNKPIKGYLQLVKLVLYIICGLMILGTFLKKDIFTLLAGFGAMAAVLMLIFQNTILSVVASIQISSYGMVRIGDWIEMPSLNADGEVIDMSLHTVTVQNFDKTLTTIPTSKLVTDTFKNWRGMRESGARRIKRSLYIDQNSVHFMDKQQIHQLKDFLLLDQYLDQKSEELQKFNDSLKNDSIYNMRRLTNLGTFRAYVELYLKNHPQINQKYALMARQMQPTAQGLPIEIYAFANTIIWTEYEGIQSDIFDHLIAILPSFGLSLYQAPSGRDFQRNTVI